MPIAMDVYNRIVQCTQTKSNSSGLKQSNEIQIQMEIGHKAALRQRPTVEGFTHDWIVYVRGPEGSNIQHFVEKVEFHLHETFPKARRVVREPPYQVAESGYGGFVLPIDIYLRNNAEPKKIRFVYELFLGVTNTVSHSRCEKIAFQNPTQEFYSRLLRGGAMEDDNSPPSSPAPSGDDGDTYLQTFTTHREQHHQQQQRINPPAEKTHNAVRPGKKIPVAAEDCKVRLNARSIFGYGKSSAGDERRQPSQGGADSHRRDFEPDIVSHTKPNYGTPTRPKRDNYYDMLDGPFKSDDGGGTPKISCKRFENGTPKGQNKTVVDLEVQYVGQKRAEQNRAPVKVSDCKNVDNDDDDVCIVGWTWNTQAKRKLNADNLRAESEQNGHEHNRLAVTRKDGERFHQSAKENSGADKASKNSNFLQKSTSFAPTSSANPMIVHPQKLSSHNTVTSSVTNSLAPSKQINPMMSSPKPSTTLLPTASSKTPFNLTTANPSMSKPLPNIPVNTNTFAPKSNVPIYVTSCSVGTKSSVAPSQGKTIPHHHHPATNSFASTSQSRFAIPPQCTMSGDSDSLQFLASRIPEQSETAVVGLTNEAVELPVHEKQRRGRTKKPILVQPNFEVVKRKRGRPRKEPIATVEPARKQPALEDHHPRVSAPLNTMISGPVSVESMPSREKSTLLQDAPKTSLPNASTTTTTTTSSNGARKSLDRIGPASADPVRCVGVQSEKEKSWVFEADDEPVVKEESTHSLLSDSEVDFQSFSSGIDFRSSLTSTPIKECSSVETAEDTKPDQQQKKKSKLRIRFKPFVEKFSYDDDSDVVMSADALANNMNRHTSMNVKWVPMVDRSLMQNGREADGCMKESINQSAAAAAAAAEPHMSICLQHPNERLAPRETAAVSSDTRSTQPNRETSTQSTRTESVVAGISISSTRPELHGAKTSLKPLKSASDVIPGSMSASNAARQPTRPPACTKSIPIANARHPTQTQTHGAVENISSGTAGKAVETNQTVKPVGQPEPVSVSSGARRNCAGDASNSLLPPSRIPPQLAASDAVPDFPKSQTKSSEGRTKSSSDQDTKSVDNSEHRKPKENLTAQPQPRITQSHQRQVPPSGSQNSAMETARAQQPKTIARHKSRPNVVHGDTKQTTGPRDPVGLLPVVKVGRDESKLRSSIAQKELSSGRKRKVEDTNDDDDKENQPKRAKTLSHEAPPTECKATNVTAVVDSDKMAAPPSQKTAAPAASGGDGKYVVVPNGEHVAALLDLQRKLMSISDMSLLRRVVQIIEETGKYRLNEATFDFDLCNLDPLTVKKLQHCLSAIC